ncbi:MAG: 3-oxoacyl-[acyl-carrier-protein] reductase [Candidatus Delongbacteria bacterium]|nr:3-oxoacyl-[acyl-carrier-protein] reductase [Candidatus Delongbacteria bacterium]MCG2760401.1 3-oxoacyl-[acyl-carrier-protein] reductase [Candidatus Delongbacteria bacterium]
MLKDKVAVITGSARGIGKAIAEEYASNGAKVVISDILQDLADGTALEIKNKFNTETMAVKADVSKYDEVENLISQTIEKFGKIDILVNNAGITRDNLIMRMSDQEWDLVININLKGVFNCTKAVTRPMMKQRSGRIINITSVVGEMGNAGQINYSASKAGVIGMTKTTAKELGSRGVRVNAIAPGFIVSEMTDKLSDQAKESLTKLIPLGNLGYPKDVANAAVFLASDMAEYITGQVLNVDGGMVMQG